MASVCGANVCGAFVYMCDKFLSYKIHMKGKGSGIYGVYCAGTVDELLMFCRNDDSFHFGRFRALHTEIFSKGHAEFFHEFLLLITILRSVVASIPTHIQYEVAKR